MKIGQDRLKSVIFFILGPPFYCNMTLILVTRIVNVNTLLNFFLIFFKSVSFIVVFLKYIRYNITGYINPSLMVKTTVRLCMLNLEKGGWEKWVFLKT